MPISKIKVGDYIYEWGYISGNKYIWRVIDIRVDRSSPDGNSYKVRKIKEFLKNPRNAHKIDEFWWKFYNKHCIKVMNEDEAMAWLI